ncbi:DUF2326 domain-containing protein [Acinetobacter baumannii]|nr:DUF2326 domain-containing protein [Acinetobacter baumannii]
MLKEIYCPIFKEKTIRFHNGLNIIVGDDDAKNSIGKSSALMVIDFVFGGKSLLEDKAGVIAEFGSHSYSFCFNFYSVNYFYSRSTSSPEIVSICNEKYERISDITIEDFQNILKEKYNLNNYESSFRNLISPFSRIWGKKNINTDSPFSSYTDEASGKAINRLIDLFNCSSLIVDKKNVIDNLNENKNLLNKSMKFEIIPNINKKKYRENNSIIDINLDLIDKIKQGVAETLSVYESLFDEELIKLQSNKNSIFLIKNELDIKIKRIKNEIDGMTPHLSENIALVQEFFPTVNVERLQQVEEFHKKISQNVKKQLKEELSITLLEEKEILNQIESLDLKIKKLLDSKGMPNDLFTRVFDLKEATDKALLENKYFEKKEELSQSLKDAKESLRGIYSTIFSYIERKVNLQLRNFNKVVYGPQRKSSKLIIKKEDSFTFSSESDSGTGKSYAGLVGFDIAMLACTSLPIIIHDSVIYKNIEVDAIKNIFRIFAAIKKKQIFLSFDEIKKYGYDTEFLINKHTVLKLGNNKLLYIRDWREESN